MPAATPRKPSEQYDWQKARLTTPGGKAPPGCILTRGYGPDGSYSLYLPTPNAKRVIQFRDGKPTVTVVDSCMAIPGVPEAREWVLRCAARAVPLAELVSDIALVRYSVALLLAHYKLSDDDLGMLHSGTFWQDPIIKHAMGGDGVVNSLRSIAPERIREISAQAARGLSDATEVAATFHAPDHNGVIVEPADSQTISEVAAIVDAGETLDNFDPTNL